jgi:hypothetical protein
MAMGEHGVNPGEFSAPSSSVLWPALLAPWWWLLDATLVPLGLCLLAAGATLAAGGRLLDRILPDEAAQPTARLLLVALLGIANVVCLVISGMEHMLQVALTAWLAVGLVEVDDDQPTPTWLLPVAVALPLVRFEDMGMVLTSAAWLGWRGRPRDGAALAGLAIVPVVAYIGWLYAQTGHPLPNSVLSKQSMFPPAWTTPWDPAIALPILLSGATLARTRHPLAGLALAASLGHLVLAQIGLLNRYVTYLHVWSAFLCAWALREPLRAAVLAGADQRRIVGWIVLILAIVNAKATYDLPGAQQQIYRMHGQLHRLATEHLEGGIAVNDIGWVAYDNDGYVLDLVGLASAEALEHRLADDPPDWMATLSEQHDVEAIVIYRHWFRALPEGWVPVGKLVVDWTSFVDDDRQVLILAPSREAAPALLDTLDTFAQGLPQGVRFVRP